SQIFAERRLNGLNAIAPFEQWLTGSVDIQRDSCWIKKSIDAYIGAMRIDAWSSMPHREEFIANGSFDAQRHEIQAGERTVSGTGLALDCVGRTDRVGPGKCMGGAIDVVLRRIKCLAALP